MSHRLAHIALVVRDYDEAIRFYTEVMGFRLLEDIYQPEQDKRWVLVQPSGGGASILLARATNEIQTAAIGNQSGGRVFLFLDTDDLTGDLVRLRAHGVTVIREPKTADYGTVAVIKDIYGNLWDLIERPKES